MYKVNYQSECTPLCNVHFAIYSKMVLLMISLGLFCTLNASPFVSARLIGQLGNQFFQIAAATSLAIDNDATTVFPDLVNSQEFNIPLNYSKVFYHLNVATAEPLCYHYTEPQFPYTPISYHPNMCIQGWFQCEKYFSRHKREILELFAPSKEISDYLTSKYANLLNHPCTVAVHFRSYLQEDPLQKVHPTQTKEYYEKAVAYYPEDSLFIVCSNDIPLCKIILSDIQRKFVFIEGEPHYHDIYLMSLCKHNIISNSSFSWWSAYLNQNPNKIVTSPKKWFTPVCGMDYKDIIPEEWIAIDY